MNKTLIQLIASGVLLGGMCGAVLIHSLHISGARELVEESGRGSDPARASMGGGPFYTPAAGAELGTLPAGPGMMQAGEISTTVLALEEIVARLQELKSENSSLTAQLEETNRDLMELQFRVDSHSESFRPMRISSGPGGSDSHLLLPPKDP